MQPAHECTVTKNYIRFNPDTGLIEYTKPGDVVQVTDKELEEFSDCLEISKPTRSRSRKQVGGEE